VDLTAGLHDMVKLKFLTLSGHELCDPALVAIPTALSRLTLLPVPCYISFGMSTVCLWTEESKVAE
jgi:hypothetical protein